MHRKKLIYMKKILIFNMICVACFIFYYEKVEASRNQSIININGVSISLEKYELLKNIGFNDSEIEAMSQESFNIYKDIKNINVSNSINKYYRETVINDFLNEYVIFEEITEEEYDNEESMTMHNLLTDIPTVSYETTYKKLSVMATIIDSSKRLILSNLYWKKLPKVRSYDIFAVRVTGGEIIPDAFGGSMTSTESKFDENCTINGTKDYTKSFDKNSATFNTASAGIGFYGIGFTAKLHNNSAACQYDLGLKLSEAVNYKASLSFKTFKGATVNISYQHATKSVDYNSVRRGYSFKSSGLGGVVYFNNSLKDSFDGMKGVSLIVQ